jgi:hypothetical protein
MKNEISKKILKKNLAKASKRIRIKYDRKNLKRCNLKKKNKK